MLVDQVGEVLQDLAARPWVQSRPRTMIESRTRRRHRGVRVSRLRPGELRPRVEPSRAEFTARVEPSIAARRSPPMKMPSGMLDIGGQLPPIGGRYRVGNHALNQSFLGLDQSIELKYVWALTIAGRTCGTSTAVDPRTTSSDRQGRG